MHRDRRQAVSAGRSRDEKKERTQALEGISTWALEGKKQRDDDLTR